MSNASSLMTVLADVDWHSANIPKSYVDAWRQLHYAAQIIAEVGKSWSPPQRDDSHSNLGWFSTDATAGFESVTTTTTPRFRARLHAATLNLDLKTDDDDTVATFDLAGHSLADGMAWLDREASKLAGPRHQPAVPAPDLPDHPVASGTNFDNNNHAAFEAMTKLYANTDALLQAMRSQLPDASAVRTWPHHFDHALLSVVQTDTSGDMTATIGIGITPPDGLNDAGYWYVSPWLKQASPASMPWNDLPFGNWIDRKGSVPMALLAVTAIGKDDHQNETVSQFIAHATATCLQNLQRKM